MKQIGLLKALIKTLKYKKLTRLERDNIRNKRLKELVEYAKNNSPYFKEAYKELDDTYVLTDLPVTNKVEMMENFDRWVTDRDIHIKDIMEFTKSLDNIGRKFMREYLVFTTSGSTGNPSVVVYDKTALSVMGAVGVLRAYARKEDIKAFIKGSGKTAGVFATGGFYLSNSSVRSRQLAMPWKKKQMMVTSVLNPISKIVEELNSFQPAMLGGYPTALEVLCDEQKNGRLHISPIIIMTGGEYLSKETRQLLKNTFGCYVQTNYSCTEGGVVSCECLNQHFHVNDDWIIMEPVDKDNKPVKDGIQADKWLLTNLSNFTQPLIRFEITDRIILHSENCPCGNPSPWVEIEGRTDDILIFETEKGIVKVPPLALYAILKEIHEILRFQLILKNNNLELRMVCKNENEQENTYVIAKDKITQYLYDCGIENVELTLSKTAPSVNNESGKFKHICKMES